MSESHRFTIVLSLLGLLVAARLLVSAVGLELAVAEQRAALSWGNVIMAALLGGLGTLAAQRARLSFFGPADTDRWHRFGLPALLGLSAAVLVIAVDLSGTATVVTRRAHASFPGIIPLYLYAGLYLGLVLRLGVVTLLVWLIAGVLLRDRGHRVVFWIVAAILTALLTAGQLVSFARMSSPEALGTPGVLLLFVIGGVFDLVLYGLYLRRGLLASLTAHLAYLALWHMIWGGVVGQVLWG